ncbi:hypothetical protein SARC_17151, partial [Sphaeroforma arctica JP610]
KTRHYRIIQYKRHIKIARPSDSYPHAYAESFTDVEVEEMTFTHMYVSNDYVAELKRWEDPQHTVEHTRVVQLPFVRPNPITIEERKKRK